MRHLSWRDALVVGLPMLALVLLAFWLTSRYIKPAPPDRLAMATGADGGLYQQYGERYRAILARNGITLDLKPSAGSVENLARLRAGSADVAFVQGGTDVSPTATAAADTEVVVSLGALYYEAVWVFHRQSAARVERLTDLAAMRLAVGPVGSGTRQLALSLLTASGVDVTSANVSPLTGEAAAAALERGEVDVVFVIGGAESPLVARLLGKKDLRLMGIAQSNALARRLPYLKALTLPRGIVDLKADLPSAATETVAVTANLLVRDEVHPALMYLLLDAATEIHGRQSLLAEPGTFPNPRNQDQPLADEAERFFKQGKPFLQRYLPFWLANLVDRMLVLLIPILAVLVPAIRFLPDLYTYRLKSRVTRWYGQLRALEGEIGRDSTPAKVTEYLARLDALEQEVNTVPLPTWFADNTYALRSAIDLVRERLGRPGAKAIPGLRD